MTPRAIEIAHELISRWSEWERDAGEAAQIEQDTEVGNAVLREHVARFLRESLTPEEPGRAAVRSMLTACKEAVAVLRSLNTYDRVCRELIAAKLGEYDMAVVLSNVIRHLDNAAEAVERSLEPKPPGPDFEAWLAETFYGRDSDLKVEAIPHAHVLNYEQALQLAKHVWECMELNPPPWWSKYADADKLQAKIAAALALTDTGSEAFREAFPDQPFAFAWGVVEKIRETLQGG
jgi:hypothetical protein